jgi:hypothetical protein
VSKWEVSVELLRELGYDVLVHPRMESVHISLITKNGYGVYYTVRIHELEIDGGVERIVKLMNHEIKR